MKIRFDSISFIAKTATSFTSTVAALVIPDLTDKIGDIKNGGAAKETLSCMAEATSLKFVSEVMEAFDEGMNRFAEGRKKS